MSFSTQYSSCVALSMARGGRERFQDNIAALENCTEYNNSKQGRTNFPKT